MKVKLDKYINEVNIRNKNNIYNDVYSVTNSEGFVESKEYFSKEVFSKDLSNYKIVMRNMMAYNPSRINVGSVAIQNKKETVIVSPLYIIFSVNQEYLLVEYLNYFLHSNIGLNQIKFLTSGSVRDNLKFSSLKNLLMPIEDIHIQKKRIEILKKLDSLISLKKFYIDKLNKLISSLFIEMFGNPVTNTMNFKYEKLVNLGYLGRGVSKHRPRNDPKLLGGKYPLIQTGDVAKCDLFIKSYNTTYSEIGFNQSKIWKSGTLCITIAGNIAKTGILKFNSCFPDSIVGFISNNKVNNIYIHYWFSFFQKILEMQAPESAQKNINLRILGELKVIIPSVERQNQFAKKVQQIDKSKLAIQQSLEKLEILKKSLMQEYFG